MTDNEPSPIEAARSRARIVKRSQRGLRGEETCVAKRVCANVSADDMRERQLVENFREFRRVYLSLEKFIRLNYKVEI